MADPEPIDVTRALAGLRRLHGRTPHTTDDQAAGSFARLADCGAGGVFVADFDGRSEWERHTAGDEVVQVLEGATTLVLLADGREVRHELRAGELLVVPRGTWHRFETDGVKLLTVTPQPTDHRSERPEG